MSASGRKIKAQHRGKRQHLSSVFFAFSFHKHRKSLILRSIRFYIFGFFFEFFGLSGLFERSSMQFLSVDWVFYRRFLASLCVVFDGLCFLRLAEFTGKRLEAVSTGLLMVWNFEKVRC